MIPIRDTIPSHRRPVVTVALIAANVLAFVYELSLGGGLEHFLGLWAMIPARVAESDAPLVARTMPLLSSLFLHGGWMHLGGNMLYLWIFADNVEDRLGHGRFLLFYLLSGIAASLTHAAFYPASTVPVVGASGAVAGVLGAYFITYPRSRVLTLIPIIIYPWFVEIPALLYLGVWFAMQLLSSTADIGAGGGVAFLAHVGGFIAGIVLCIVMRPEEPRDGDVARWPERRQSYRWM